MRSSGLSATPPIGPSLSLRPRRGGERTAERILDEAEALFAERGYWGATLRDVAARVGVSAPGLYNHFASKDALYAAVLERGIGPVFAALAGTDGSPRRSREIVADVMRILARRPSLPHLILHETLSGGQRLTPMLREWIAPSFARGRELLEANPGARPFAPEQIPLLVLAMYHVVVGYFTIAPLYRGLTGIDLLADEALARQADFLGELVARLLPQEEARGSG